MHGHCVLYALLTWAGNHSVAYLLNLFVESKSTYQLFQFLI